MKLFLSTCALTVVGVLANLHQTDRPSVHVSTESAPTMVVDDTQYFSLADIGVVPDSDGNITWYEGDDDGGKPARAAAPAIVDCGSGIPAATGGTKGTGANAVALLAARAAYIDAQKKLLANANFLCTACPVPGACGRFTMTITTGWVTPIPAKAAGGGFTATATYTGAYMGACTDCPQ